MSEDASLTAPAAADPDRGAGGTVALVLSGAVTALGALVLIAGLAVVAIHSFGRDDDGFYTSDVEQLRSAGHAIVTDDVDLGASPGDVAPEDLLGDVRFRAESADGSALFVGIARTTDLDSYLEGVAASEITDFGDGNVDYREVTGGAPVGAPASQPFWVAESEGPGERVVEWEVESGNWSVAVMNADGSRGVSVDADAGVQIGWLLWVGLGLVLLGLVVGAVGVVLIVTVRKRAAGVAGDHRAA